MSEAEEKKVLVVDDSMRIRTSVHRLLMQTKFKTKIIMAKDGEDAKHQMTKDMPDVIITDTGMPRMDGFDFIRYLRQNSDTQEMPVMVIAAFLTLDEQEMLRDHSVNAVVLKPLHEQEFISAFENCFVMAEEQ